MSNPAAPRTLTKGSAAALFLQLLYGRGSGYVELAWIDGDPDDREHYVFDRTWFDFSPERLGELLDQIEELAQQYGNVYVSAHLYDAPRRDALVLPGHAIFVDDLPQGVLCSFSVHTSPTRRHGYFLLSQPAAREELRELSKRAAYAFAGDKSGWDLQQLVRVPGTYNTKARHGGHHLVTLQMGTQRRYSPAELRETWPEAGSPEGEDKPLDWPEVEHWLGNLGALIGDGGLPRRLKASSQTGKVLLAELDDTSLARYIVAKGLALHGCPDDKIAALLWHCCEYGKVATKSTAWLKADIQRIIGKVRAEGPDIRSSPTRARGEARPQPIAEQKPARRGRKTTLTPAALLQWYEGQRSCSDVIMLTVAEVAERLGVSRATVERCERRVRLVWRNTPPRGSAPGGRPAARAPSPAAPARAPDAGFGSAVPVGRPCLIFCARALAPALDPERRRREREEYMALAERELRRQKAEGRRPPRGAAPPQAGALGGACSPNRCLPSTSCSRAVRKRRLPASPASSHDWSGLMSNAALSA